MRVVAWFLLSLCLAYAVDTVYFRGQFASATYELASSARDLVVGR